jgi:hypothetical protein
MTQPNTLDATLANDQDPPEVVAPDSDIDAAESDTEPIVRKLRDESAKHRTRAKDAESRVDELSREVFRLKVAALDKLADVTDLPYSPDLLDDDALAAAVDELIATRPHYAKRIRPNGPVGQGNQGSHQSGPSFANLLQQN